MINENKSYEDLTSFRQSLHNLWLILKCFKTYLKDYQEAINSNTAMLFKAHKSNYEIAGFSKEVDYQEIIALAQEKGLLDYYDLGSGYFGLKCRN